MQKFVKMFSLENNCHTCIQYLHSAYTHPETGYIEINLQFSQKSEIWSTLTVEILCVCVCVIIY